MDLRRGLALLGLAVLAILVVVGVAFLSGVFGVPTVDDVQNRFAGVNDSTTVVGSTVEVTNPNPFDVSLSGLDLDYTITMNGVGMGRGHQEGVSLSAGNASVPLRTYIDNDRIPQWWYTHVENGERTTVTVHANVSHDLLGETVTVPRQRSFETDVLSGFNTTTTRAIDADLGIVSDPVLFVNETSARWGRNVTRTRTPIRLAATVYNPKPFPYAISAVGYTVEMNGVRVGAGRTTRRVVVPAAGTDVIRTRAVLTNAKLDEWWVRHLRRGQRTTVSLDLYLVVDPPEWLPVDAERIRIDHPSLAFNTTFETDVFGERREAGGFVGDAVPGRRAAGRDSPNLRR